jgi:hypothetical protein
MSPQLHTQTIRLHNAEIARSAGSRRAPSRRRRAESGTRAARVYRGFAYLRVPRPA